jgi:ABC-type nitrate/sulfonate/bicarbonate transport system permease component
MKKPYTVLATSASLLLLILIASSLDGLSSNNPFVVYFGTPRDARIYAAANWQQLSQSAGKCLLTALLGLALAGILSTLLLSLGLLRHGWLTTIERLAAVSQTIPILVIVAFALIVETTVFHALNIAAPVTVYCIPPVTLGLLFPPLVNGADAVSRLPLELRALLRLWAAPIGWRVFRVYLPAAVPSILTGLRTSATWAISGTLIAEGLLNGVEGDSSTLGHFLVRPFSSGEPGRLPSVIAISTLLGFAVYYLFVLLQTVLERKLLGLAAEVEQSYPLQTDT